MSNDEPLASLHSKAPMTDSSAPEAVAEDMVEEAAAVPAQDETDDARAVADEAVAEEPASDTVPAAPLSLAERLRSDEFYRKFKNIVIEPGGPNGWPAGPIWPADAPMGLERHWVSGHPVRTSPPPSGKDPEVLEGPHVWAGAVMPHFGHFVSEHCQRLLFSKLLFPNATFIFTTQRSDTVPSLPSYFWHVCDWFGIDRKQIKFVHDRPVLVKQLHVLRQGELLQRVNLPIDVFRHKYSGPLPEYMEGLNALQETKGLPLATGGLVYVSRSKLTPITVRMPGETYLEDRLQALGAKIIWPETVSLREQIETYAEAKTIIFAEGSSVHVRQFLGYLPQKVIVFVRRKGLEFGSEYLEPRVDEFSYVDATVANLLFATSDNGAAMRHTCSAVLDQDVMLAQFADQGIDLYDGWDRDAFKARHDADLIEWAEDNAKAVAHMPNRFDHCLNILSASLLAAGEMGLHIKLKAAAERQRPPKPKPAQKKPAPKPNQGAKAK